MIELNFDGFCEINPGTIGGYGVIIKRNKKTMKLISERFSDVKISNNVAEYKGLFSGLLYLLNLDYNREEIRVYGDSMLVIMQMCGCWKIKKGLYKNIALETKKLIEKFSNISFEWIPREKNLVADELSKIHT